MCLKVVAEVLGFAGDAVTFAGALVLALKEAGEEDRARERIGTVTALKAYPELKKISIDVEGVIVTREEDVEIAVAKRSSSRSRLGAWILAAGFVLLFFSRLFDVLD